MGRNPEYDDVAKPIFERADALHRLLEELLNGSEVKFHSVTHRVKSEMSARAKIEGSPDKYGGFSDLHDLLGFRVITNLATEVEDVVRTLRGAFEIDEARSSNKLSKLKDDEFGYRSVHLVAQLSEVRARLTEWKSCADLVFEIQVRSILQHAWAEIEHDLGYKSSTAVPKEISRRFARLAGLLELADEEFDRLVLDSDRHAKKVTRTVRQGGNVPVERDSILALTTGDSRVADADALIAAATGRPLALSAELKNMTLRAEELRSEGFEAIDEINNLDADTWVGVSRFASGWLLHEWSDGDERDPLPRGISLFYLYLHLKLSREGEKFSSVPAMSEIPESGTDLQKYRLIHREHAINFLRIHSAAFENLDSEGVA